MAYLWGCDGATARPWSDHEFLDNFCTVFKLSRNGTRKICVPRLLMNVCPSVFFPVKNCVKMQSELSFWGEKKWFFLRRWPSPLLHAPTTLGALGASPPYWNPKYATDSLNVNSKKLFTAVFDMLVAVKWCTYTPAEYQLSLSLTQFIVLLVVAGFHRVLRRKL